MMHRLIFAIALQLFVSQLISQNTIRFQPPLEIPLYLSGNFGELREDHFHSGIDIKTLGVTGQAVHSIEEGYISRIKVQSNGYGKSIYISHPTGHTSVYGHLDHYRSDIALYVKKMQYERRAHEVDIYLKPGQFQIGKGEIIGYSGNTGSSSGPHLHFEIRTSGDQHPTNVLKYGFDIKDRLPPRFLQFFLYPEGDSSHVNQSRLKFSSTVISRNGTCTPASGPVVTACGTIGCGVEVFDYLDGVPNRCGVYRLVLYVNGSPVYQYTMDEFAFSETRFVNAHMDYGEWFTSGTRVHRLYRLPNDRLRIYQGLVSDGMLKVEPGREYDLRVVASDVAGNTAELNFRIRGESAKVPPEPKGKGNVQYMPYDRVNRFTGDSVVLEIPAYALYEDLEFTFVRTEAENGMLSSSYHIHTPEIPVHLPYRLSIRTGGLGAGLNEKLCLVTRDRNNEIAFAGGEYADGAVTAEVRNFGTFAISLDTVAPEIIPLGGNCTGDLSGTGAIRFTARDDLAGIENYEGYIDNRWALFEYDPKNELLTYTFDAQRIEKGKVHELELYVTDAKGNVNLFHTTFTW
jgi:murein DD-endopeptidase MepM/ murein hydrolase activator NlpD